jgi:hypothetical protein
VFAANSPFRKQIILRPEEKKGFDFAGGEKKRMNKSWSLMLARVFKIDVMKYDCGGINISLGEQVFCDTINPIFDVLAVCQILASR